MYLLYLAAQRVIPATLSITADTGSENDRVCSTGERITARQFFDNYVQPYARQAKIEAVFVRALDADKRPLPALVDTLKGVQIGDSISVPLFTNDRTQGRLRQSCTDKWKVRAIHQEARRRGIKTLYSAIGFHAGEAHRIKGEYLETISGFDYYQPMTKRGSQLRKVKWLRHYYPLIDLRLNRSQIRAALDRLKIPYLLTTECDHCPHQDYDRWSMHTPEVINELAALESTWGGKLFLTDQRIPLKDALVAMAARDQIRRRQGELFTEPEFGCDDGAYCGI